MNDADRFNEEMRKKLNKPLRELLKEIDSMGRFKRDAARATIIEIAKRQSRNIAEATGIINLASFELYTMLKAKMVKEFSKQDKEDENKNSGMVH